MYILGKYSEEEEGEGEWVEGAGARGEGEGEKEREEKQKRKGEARGEEEVCNNAVCFLLIVILLLIYCFLKHQNYYTPCRIRSYINIVKTS